LTAKNFTKYFKSIQKYELLENSAFQLPEQALRLVSELVVLLFDLASPFWQRACS